GVLHDPGRHPPRRARGDGSGLRLLATADGPTRADVQPDRGLFFFRSKGGGLGVDYEEVRGWKEVVDAYARGEPYFEPAAAKQALESGSSTGKILRDVEGS